jgi:UTP--glucose-1-phosphate uridylyltransferase
MHLQVKKAILPVAGLGTRFLPITKSIPKEMLAIVDRPMIQLIVEEALASGISQIILINGHHKGNIEDFFDTNYELNNILAQKGDIANLEIVEKISSSGFICSLRQKAALGLGHAILCARPLIGNEPFAVLLGDDLIFTDAQTPPALAQLIENYYKTGIAQVALITVDRKEIHKYGAAEGNSDPKNTHNLIINNLVEKPPQGTERTDQAVVGRYVLTPALWNILEKSVPSNNGEIQLTDALFHLMKTEGLMGYRFLGTRVDAGDRIGYLHANLMHALLRPELKQDTILLMKKLLQKS